MVSTTIYIFFLLYLVHSEFLSCIGFDQLLTFTKLSVIIPNRKA